MTRLGLVLSTLLCGCRGTPADIQPDPPAAATDEADAPAAQLESDTETETGLADTETAEAPSDPAEPDVFTPATRGSGACEVTVSALLEATEYRGPGPMTPAVAASLDANPDYAETYSRMSHGDHHIQCVYQVELGGSTVHHRWRTHFTNTLRKSTTKACNGLAASVAEDIIRTTKDCTDFDAGAYWGYVLEPLP